MSALGGAFLSLFTKRKLANICIVTPIHHSSYPLLVASLGDNNKDTNEIVDSLTDTETGSFVLVDETKRHSGTQVPKTKRVDTIQCVDGVLASLDNDLCPETREEAMRMRDKWLEIRQTQQDPSLPVLVLIVDREEMEAQTLTDEKWKIKFGTTDKYTEFVCILPRDVQERVTLFRATCTKRAQELGKQKEKMRKMAKRPSSMRLF